MESNPMPQSKYLGEVLEKYDFITKLYITDTEGNLICSSKKEIPEEKDEKEKEESERIFRLRIASFYNNLVSQATSKECTGIKGLTTVYDDIILYQVKINNCLLIHIVCDEKGYNHSVVKDIVNELKEKLEKVSKEIESKKKEQDS